MFDFKVGDRVKIKRGALVNELGLLTENKSTYKVIVRDILYGNPWCYIVWNGKKANGDRVLKRTESDSVEKV